MKKDKHQQQKKHFQFYMYFIFIQTTQISYTSVWTYNNET